MTRELVAVWREPDAGWRWAFLSEDTDASLPSNERYETHEDAVNAARIAYPDVEIRDTPPPDAEDHDTTWLELLAWGAAAALLLHGLRGLRRRPRAGS